MNSWAEWYAQTLYPIVSNALSWVSSFFPFSISDCFICISIAGMLVYAVLHIRKSPWKTLGKIGLYFLGVCLWFYLAWGLNYFREPFYKRAGIEPLSYDSVAFEAFLAEYTEQLNASYIPDIKVDTLRFAEEIKEQYRGIALNFGMKLPQDFHKAKPMLVSSVMSSAGVLGYIGPFFNEATLNADLLPVQYPSTYAHEMAHLLGIAGEGEANFYAWFVCSSSSVLEIRFAGWFSLLPYLIGNARRTLPREKFEAWVAGIRPEVKELYNEKNAYWRDRYSNWWGSIQDWVYNLYLKGNRVSGGTANYSEVVGMVMAWDAQQKIRD